MASRAYSNLLGRNASDEVLTDKVFENDSNPKYNGFQRKVTSVVYKVF